METEETTGEARATGVGDETPGAQRPGAPTRPAGDLWRRLSPSVSDMVAAGFVAFMSLSMVPVLGTIAPAGSVFSTLVLVPMVALPFLARRSYPGPAASVVVLGLLVHLAVVPGPSGAVVAAPMAMYAVARWSPQSTVRRAFVLVAAVASALAGFGWTYGPSSVGGSVDLAVGIALVCFGAAFSAWLLGALLRQRDEARAEVRRRTEAVEQGRIQNIRLAAQEERARIAREMHDVVAHSLSVVVVQSDGASYALERAAESGDPETMASALDAARTALATIGQTARESLADTRRLVAVLRQDDGGVDYSPTAGLDALDDLVEPLRAAGLAIQVDITGHRRLLPRDADLAAYRVIQESLTNVIKHAGEAAVWVSLDYLEAVLMITVRDNGVGVTVAPDGAGHGLVGMKERVTAVGGGIWAGGAPGGGFVVEARIPYDGSPTRSRATTRMWSPAVPTEEAL